MENFLKIRSNQITWIIILFSLVITSCFKNKEIMSEAGIEVSWDLINNSTSEKQYAKAAFTLVNRSDQVLGSSNWLMYFNMLPCDIISSADTVFADVLHISGDWYKLVPRNHFELQKDSSIRIYYEMNGSRIKISDAPVGCYFVFYDAAGKELAVKQVSQYTVKPFSRPEQILRNPYDCEELPTAENRFYAYTKKQILEKPLLMPLIPSPKYLETGKGRCIVNEEFRIYFDRSSETEAKYLAKKLREIAGINLEIILNSGIREPGIYLHTNGIKGESHDAYNLEIKPGHIQISGEREGIFYGIQSLINLIPFETYRKPKGEFELPVMVIEDAPRFSYRGLHIDVCRNFQTRDQILKILDLMAYYKLNILLLYLTEDEGWRLEIQELPELTSVGSIRGHALNELEMLHPSYGSGPYFDAKDNHGTGHYSRKDFKDILRYAFERHIQVIPAINLPGHARAAIKSMEARYHYYSMKGQKTEAEEFRLIDPDDRSIYKSAQYYQDNVVCVARESVYHFFETVVDDVIEMYAEAGVPLGMIYTGGDEVPEGAWAGSPICRQLLDSLPGIHDPKNLQQYFLSRINKILLDRSLKTGGWEEIVLEKGDDQTYHVNTGFTGKKVIPYVWNSLGGSQDLAYRIANAGYSVVLCPVTNFYFDLAYSNDPEEPGSYWSGFVNERNPWAIAPYNIFFTLTKDEMGCDINQEGYKDMVRLRQNAKENILGLQAQLWHETIRGGDMMEYYLLPKLISFAERCWAGAPVWESVNDINRFGKLMEKSWVDFEYSLYEQELPKLSYFNGGYNYRIPPAGAIIENNKVLILASNPALKIRYALNGDTPDEKSVLYEQPIEPDQEIKIRVFDKSGRSSKVSTICR